MKAISLFSGCGGADFGMQRLNIDVVLSTDIMPDACETLRRYFNHSEVINTDIRELTKFPDADLVVGGYPCQSFSLAGNRAPSNDPRSYLYLEFARVVDTVKPKYFIAENVSGMAGLENGRWFNEQLKIFEGIGNGYNVSHAVLNARDYGIPQRRKRVIIVGVEKTIGGKYFKFPEKTHGSVKEIKRFPYLKPFASHGDVIKHLPIWPKGEFYERPHDPEGHFSWYYMSRNRKARWNDPSFCVVANFRHITLHPASPTMEMEWSNLADGFKQKWRFTESYEHLDVDPTYQILETPRRLSWREAALIQTFPDLFEPTGKLEKKFEQIGNAIPPKLFEILFAGLKNEDSFQYHESKYSDVASQQMSLL
jgi:DNA (cytosine-5)-methyltransferase 1